MCCCRPERKKGNFYYYGATRRSRRRLLVPEENRINETPVPSGVDRRSFGETGSMLLSYFGEDASGWGVGV